MLLYLQIQHIKVLCSFFSIYYYVMITLSLLLFKDKGIPVVRRLSSQRTARQSVQVVHLY